MDSYSDSFKLWKDLSTELNGGKETVLYDEFKMWKETYTTLNVCKKIIFFAEDKKIKMLFDCDTSFYKLEGYLNYYNDFYCWLMLGHVAVVNIEDIVELGKVLKKNALEAEGSDLHFKYRYLDKDGNEKTKYFMDASSSVTVSDLIEGSKQVLSQLKYSQEYTNVALDNTHILSVSNGVGSKILETPLKTLIPVHKKIGNNFTVSWSDTRDDGIRYVSVYENDEAKKVELTQIFATI